MITIAILGIDQFVVGRYSKENTANLASLFETSEDNIAFYAPNSMVFHAGVEQTSWDVLVVVHCPNKYHDHSLAKNVADYIGRTMALYAVNIRVEFDFFDDEHSYEYINPSYPRFLKEDNVKEVDVTIDGDDGDDCDCEEHSESPDLDYDDPESIYTGNAFEGFEEKIAGKNGNKDN